MLRMLAIFIGILFICFGVAGFLSTFKTNGLLFNFFAGGLIQNILYIITGVLAIMVATDRTYVRRFFQIIGLLYAILAIIGFWRQGDLFVMHLNTADNILHIGIAVIALIIGFSKKE